MKKTILFLLIASLLLALIGCTQETSPDPSGASIPPTQSTAPSDKVPDETSSDPMEIKLPLSDELITFTMWGCTPQAGADLITENDSYARQELERRTNVHIEWNHPSIGQELTAFNLLLASGDMTDAITGTVAYFTGGMDKYINDDLIIPLEDYGQYYPNYNHWRSQQDMTLLSTVTDGGHIAGIHQLRVPYQPQWQGPIVREDLLGAIGFNKSADDIVTVSDWEDVLTRFKDYGMKIPYLVYYNSNGLDPFLMATFGLYGGGINTSFFQLDNTVHYTAYEASFKDYLVLMQDWFSKGLIDVDFYNRDNPTFFNTLIQGDVGIGSSYKAYIDYANMNTVGDNIHWAGISAPVQKAGQKFEACYALTSRLLYQGQVMTITSSCKEELIPIILQYHDYGFSDDGSTLATYGVEGTSYDRDADGNIKLYDVVTKNPDGFGLNQTFNKYCMFHSAVYRYDWRRSENNISDQAKQIYQKWEANYADDAVEMPALSIAADAVTEYSNKFNDIDTFAKEFAMSVILGQRNIDTEWDGYIAQLEAMGVKDIIGMQQAALDGFYNRDASVGFPN